MIGQPMRPPHLPVLLRFVTPGATLTSFAKMTCAAGGQLVSAIVGVTVRHILWRTLWLSTAVGMAVSLSVMQLLKCLHPPGRAPPPFPSLVRLRFRPRHGRLVLQSTEILLEAWKEGVG